MSYIKYQSLAFNYLKKLYLKYFHKCLQLWIQKQTTYKAHLNARLLFFFSLGVPNVCLFSTKFQFHVINYGHTVLFAYQVGPWHDDRLRLCTQHDKTFSKQIFVESDVWINWLGSGSSYTHTSIAFMRIRLYDVYSATYGRAFCYSSFIYWTLTAKH